MKDGDGGEGSRRPKGRTERAQVVEARKEGQEGQSNEQEERNNDAPGPAPAYDPASVIDHMKTLNQQEQEDFLDRVMEGGMGFLMPLDASVNNRAEKGEVYTVYIRRVNVMKMEFTFKSVQREAKETALLDSGAKGLGIGRVRLK